LTLFLGEILFIIKTDNE